MAKIKIVKNSKGKVVSSSKIGEKLPERPVLEKHEVFETIAEHYSYIDSSGKEQKYVGIISKSSDSAVGKTFETHKVILKYHPAVEHVEGNDEFFTYIDSAGTEHRYTDKIEYDLEKNTYVGRITEHTISNKIVEIFEEK